MRKGSLTIDPLIARGESTILDDDEEKVKQENF